MQWIHLFPPRPPVQIRMHHLPYNRPRTDQRDLHHQVIKGFRTQPRQGGLLRPAFHLKHPDGVALLQRFVDLRIVLRQLPQIDLFLPVIPDQHQAILQRRHHPQPEQIHLDEPQVRAVFLVPLHHHAPRHRRGFQRHHRIQPALADHHASRMLPQMARQILQVRHDIDEIPHPVILRIQSRLPKPPLRFFVATRPAPSRRQTRNLIQRLDIEPQHLARLARRELSAIRDHVRRHGRAVLSVALIHILDRPFPLFAARQVDIDIGPLPALFRQKPLEQQFHPHRIHRRDPQRITDRAVRRRAAPLTQNPLFAAKPHNVPDDQEIAAQPQLFDQPQFFRDLRLRRFMIGFVAPARPGIGEFPQIGGYGFPWRQRIIRKLIAQIFQREFQPRGDLLRIRDRLRQIREQPHHLRAALQIALRIQR